MVECHGAQSEALPTQASSAAAYQLPPGPLPVVVACCGCLSCTLRAAGEGLAPCLVWLHAWHTDTATLPIPATSAVEIHMAGLPDAAAAAAAAAAAGGHEHGHGHGHGSSTGLAGAPAPSPDADADPQQQSEPLTIYTVGHSRRSLRELAELLAGHGVRVLVDVSGMGCIMGGWMGSGAICRRECMHGKQVLGSA